MGTIDPTEPAKEPDKPAAAFRTISDAAEELDLPQHVLRFWETRFAQIRPLKRGGGRRYYRKDDVDLLRGIKHLLYGQGYTIKGVQRILRAQGVKFVQNLGIDPTNLAKITVTPELDGAARIKTDQAESFLERAAHPSPPAPEMARGRGEDEMDTADVISGAMRQAEARDMERSSPPRISQHKRLRLKAALGELMEARRLLSQTAAGTRLSRAEERDER